MTMVTVTARETFPYDGVTRRVGETFEATADDARILVLVGRVTAGSSELSSEPAEDPLVGAPVVKRRRYRRADMAAEE